MGFVLQIALDSRRGIVQWMPQWVAAGALVDAAASPVVVAFVAVRATVQRVVLGARGDRAVRDVNDQRTRTGVHGGDARLCETGEGSASVGPSLQPLCIVDAKERRASSRQPEQLENAS